MTRRCMMGKARQIRHINAVSSQATSPCLCCLALFDRLLATTGLGGDYYNDTVGLMEMYDVGQSSLTAQEAYSLVELAGLMGKPQALQDKLKARGDRLAALVAAAGAQAVCRCLMFGSSLTDCVCLQHTWDDSSSAFVNVFSTNGTFNPRVSPTSFYALQRVSRCLVSVWGCKCCCHTARKMTPKD